MAGVVAKQELHYRGDGAKMLSNVRIRDMLTNVQRWNSSDTKDSGFVCRADIFGPLLAAQVLRQVRFQGARFEQTWT